MKAIIEYDLFNAQDAHAYKCSQKAVEAFYTLETLMDACRYAVFTHLTKLKFEVSVF